MVVVVVGWGGVENQRDNGGGRRIRFDLRSVIRDRSLSLESSSRRGISAQCRRARDLRLSDLRVAFTHVRACVVVVTSIVRALA